MFVLQIVLAGGGAMPAERNKHDVRENRSIFSLFPNKSLKRSNLVSRTR
jgi:hypothetical protein